MDKFIKTQTDADGTITKGFCNAGGIGGSGGNTNAIKRIIDLMIIGAKREYKHPNTGVVYSFDPYVVKDYLQRNREILTNGIPANYPDREIENEIIIRIIQDVPKKVAEYENPETGEVIKGDDPSVTENTPPRSNVVTRNPVTNPPKTKPPSKVAIMKGAELLANAKKIGGNKVVARANPVTNNTTRCVPPDCPAKPIDENTQPVTVGDPTKIMGIPKKFVYIGGAVVGAVLLFVVIKKII